MPDITYPNTITADTTTSAADVAENLFKPKSTQDNLEVINGLDEANLATSPKILREMVRPGQFVVGGTSGHTANRDYFKQAYPGGWTNTNMTQASAAAIPVAGLCHTRYIPFAASLFQVHWSFGIIVDDGNTFDDLTDWGIYYGYSGSFGGTATAGHRTSVHLYVNDTRINTANYHIAHSERTLAQVDPTNNVTTADTTKAFRQDSRWISGHFTFDSTNVSGFPPGTSPLAAGFHTAEIRVASKKRIVRFKSSNISVP